MTGAWDDVRWAEDVESWEEVAGFLRGDWERVEDPSLGLALERVDGLLAVDLRGRWHARHRRGLHRLGFRPVVLGSADVWRWDVGPQLRITDLSRFASPFAAVFGADPSGARALRLRTLLARDHLVREQALCVLREVFRCEPGDLEVLVVDDDWEEDDDGRPLPVG